MTCNRKSHNGFLVLFALLLACTGLSPNSCSSETNQFLDAVPFGEIHRWETNGHDYGVFWEDPRDIVRVVVTFESGESIPDRDSLTLQYWQSQWPHRRIPRDQPSGAGSSGWLDIGDWFQGQWRTADTEVDRENNSFVYTMNPVNRREFPDLDDFSATYRTTMKLRIVSTGPLPPIDRFQALTDSSMKVLDAEILWGGTAAETQIWDGRVEIFNGFLQTIGTVSSESQIDIHDDHSWSSSVQNRMDGVRVKLTYADSPAVNSFDDTIVTVRAHQHTFSFAVNDLLQWGNIFIPDYGVLVRMAGDPMTYSDAEKAWKNTDKLDLYTRVNTMSEQTFTQAWNDTPAKDPHYIPLSFEGGRQHFRLDENGNVTCINNWINRIPGKDTPSCQWPGQEIHYKIGLPSSRLHHRNLEDGYLPIVKSIWKDRYLTYTQTCFVVPLHGIPNAGGRIWADDTLVLMMRVQIENSSPESSIARLTLSSHHRDGQETLQVDKDHIVALDGDESRVRMRLSMDPILPAVSIQENQDSLELTTRLPPRHNSTFIELSIPYITLAGEKDLALLNALDFDSAYRAVSQYWRARIGQSTQIHTPEPMINDFYNAHLAHLLINTEREVGVSDCYMAKVGTFHYGVYSNESCMMISDLDRRGLHKRAEQAINTWLKYQGTVGLPGDYSTTEGQFYGAGGYEAGGYNQHHGWILWCMGEHYWYTRDAAWLNKAAPQIVKGCDWIIHERARTKEIARQSPLRAIENGLLPPGSLEDIGDWRCWLSTNVYSWWGMKNVAASLQDIGHPDGTRLIAEAEAYRRDILNSFTEAMRRSPVVRLRDNRWIPHVPSDAHRRGRSFGWITETLEGAIHLVRAEAIDPAGGLATWIIQDFEDNLYFSKQYGYDIGGDEFERYWFSRGGISMQANLLHNPIPYILRDEVEHFLRAYFNAFAVSYFPDTRMMTEHALPNIGDWRGDHFKSSDEANSTYWLRLMFVQERGNELWYGAAIPRYWLVNGQTVSIQNASTYFGTTSMSMRSEGDVIRMTVEPPDRNPPQLIRARFRHPEEKRMEYCMVNHRRYDRFDPDREWVEIPYTPEKLEIAVFYRD